VYQNELVNPMRAELSSIGVQELLTGKDVDQWMQNKTGTALLVVNSVCGCAAGSARPGVRLALEGSVKPQRIATVFAGQDKEATDRARSYFSDYPPSSPSMALVKDGVVVEFVPRHQIEGRDAATVANALKAIFAKHCAGA